VILKALSLSVKRELAPEIKAEIDAICHDFEAAPIKKELCLICHRIHYPGNACEEATEAEATPTPTLALKQQQLVAWGVECFGEKHMADKSVRALRLLEEAIEFAQAVDAPKDQCAALVDYVYSRPTGKPEQELGGVGVTWLVAAAALGMQASDALDAEIARIAARPCSHFAARNKQKLDAGFVGMATEAETMSEIKSLRNKVERLTQWKRTVENAFTAGMLGMEHGALMGGTKLTAHGFITSLRVAMRQAEDEFMRRQKNMKPPKAEPLSLQVASEPGKLHRLARAHWDRQKKAIGSEPIDDALIADSMAVFAELHTAAQALKVGQTETPVIEYTEDQQPCIVAKNPCGCYVAACSFDDDDRNLSDVLAFLKEADQDVTFEFRPVSFVRSGGLNFGCKHGKAGRALPGK